MGLVRVPALEVLSDQPAEPSEQNMPQFVDGGDPAFHEIKGTSPTAAYKGRVRLKAHDIVTFAVGYGKNKTNYCDTTGLFARILLLSASAISADRKFDLEWQFKKTRPGKLRSP
jgi:hypothetical protein